MQEKRRRYQDDLSAVDEVADNVEEMQLQVIDLKNSLAAAQDEEEVLVQRIEDKVASIAEEEMVHEALIASLNTCQQELRSLRQRTSMSDQSNSIRQFFTEANALAKRCRHLQNTTTNVQSQSNSISPVTTSPATLTSVRQSGPQDEGKHSREPTRRSKRAQAEKERESASVQAMAARKRTIVSIEAQLEDFGRQEEELREAQL